MDLSIIIPTKNAERTLPVLLKSIAEQCTKHTVEVLVVDGVSEDNTVVEAAKSGCRVIVTPSSIYAAQNIGVGAARGRHVYFAGAGDVLQPGAVDSMLSTGADFVRGLIYASLPWPVVSRCQQAYVYATTLFDTHGLFDMEHPVYADLWFNRRLAEAGVISEYVKKPFVRIAPLGFSSRMNDTMPGVI